MGSSSARLSSPRLSAISSRAASCGAGKYSNRSSQVPAEERSRSGGRCGKEEEEDWRELPSSYREVRCGEGGEERGTGRRCRFIRPAVAVSAPRAERAEQSRGRRPLTRRVYHSARDPRGREISLRVTWWGDAGDLPSALRQRGADLSARGPIQLPPNILFTIFYYLPLKDSSPYNSFSPTIPPISIPSIYYHSLTNYLFIVFEFKKIIQYLYCRNTYKIQTRLIL